MVRARVNRAQRGGDRRLETADLLDFAKELDVKVASKREKMAANEAVSTAVDTFSAVFADADGESTGSADSDLMRKQLDKYELQLHHAREAVVAAKESDALLLQMNAKLENRVRELSVENQKLMALAKYLRQFERENSELRFIVQGFFDSSAKAATVAP
ncbi:Hypothetical Protein FCC1311_011852 [Hondaea fermentalgiana]|uniref:Uncharacterized protein n=1 Tax=Hondaea fermentalgiana TaxID=2315210 RepID=A0A2R5G5A4_9STRA|nr:Hypothetical Protein FCC1311_011852 [Hondaea fermentalgiana]|eukprot:GBG24968.1 Hypothetical Protein FCC1311_011852 [Hondaea fermentalgiana]